jgi:YihY family inner membrane protein
VFSILLLILGASGVFGELQDSLNTIWEVKPKPGLGIGGWIRTRFLSMAAVLGIAFLLLVSLFVSTLVTGISGRVMGAIFGDGTVAKVIGFLIDFVLSSAVITLLFAGMFKLLPDVKIQWRDVWSGAILTAVLFQIGKYLLSWYLGRESATSNFGPAGSAAASFVALLIWVYYSGWILFYGAEFTQVYAKTYGSNIVPSEHAEPMTAEARRQQGMEPKPDAPARVAGGGGGGARVPQFAHGDRRVVTIEQPAVMNRQGYLLAAGGVAAGFIVGAAGVLTGRKYGEPRLKAEEIDQRIKAIEARVGQKKRELRRFGREIELAERVTKIEDKVNEATSRVRRHALKNEWYNRIKSYVS